MMILLETYYIRKDLLQMLLPFIAKPSKIKNKLVVKTNVAFK